MARARHEGYHPTGYGGLDADVSEEVSCCAPGGSVFENSARGRAGRGGEGERVFRGVVAGCVFEAEGREEDEELEEGGDGLGEHSARSIRHTRKGEQKERKKTDEHVIPFPPRPPRLAHPHACCEGPNRCPETITPMQKPAHAICLLQSACPRTPAPVHEACPHCYHDKST